MRTFLEVFICGKKSVFNTVTSSHAELCFTSRFITAYYECKR